MSFEYNFWIGMSDGFQGELVPFILWEDTDLPPPPPVDFPMIGQMNEETKDFFRQSYDAGALDHLFRHYYVDPRDYRVWSFYIIKPDDVTPVRNNLDAMTTEYPQDFLIMGAWDFLTGQAVQAYPSPPSLINFMPPTWDHSTNPPVAVEPTELTDVNLLGGAGSARIHLMAYSNVVNVPFTTNTDIPTPNPTSVEDVGTGQAQLWWDSQAYIIGTDFGATQGGSTIAIEDNNGLEIAQTATAWSDTQITFTPTRSTLADKPFTIHVDRV